MADDFWTATQQVLSAIIKKPPLTEKLLSKPPFRFLHDIWKEVNAATGFGDGLFTPDELDSSKIDNKDAKISFLVKAITCVGLAAGQHIEAKPQKIVAGLDPELTNLFLQLLATTASDPTIDSPAAVSLTLAGNTMPQKGEPAEKLRKVIALERPPTSNSSVRPSSRAASHQRASAPDASSSGSVGAGAAPPTGAERPASSASRKTGEVPGQSQPSLQKDEFPQSDASQRGPSPSRRDGLEETVRTDQSTGRSQPAATLQLPSGAAPSHPQQAAGLASVQQQQQQQQQPEPSLANNGEDDASATASLRRPSRPQSARKPPPKIKSNVRPVEDQPPVPGPGAVPGRSVTTPSTGRPSSSQSVGSASGLAGSGGGSKPTTPQVVAGVLTDGQLLDDDDDQGEDEMMAGGAGGPFDVDGAAVDASAVAFGDGRQRSASSRERSEVHGKLVRDILSGVQRDSEGLRPGSVDNGQEATDAASLQIQRESIQRLCAAANSLARLFEFLHEDLETMNKEREQWRKLGKKYSLQLDDASRETDTALQPLYGQLAELDDQIREREGYIASAKGRLEENDERISKLLKMVL